MLNREQEIADFIVEHLKSIPFDTGVNLGHQIHRQFPFLNMRDQYGGLRRFVEIYCQDKVQISQDGHIITLSLRSGPWTPNSNGGSPPHGLAVSAFQAFSNPSLLSIPTINKATGQVSVATNKGAIPEGWAPVEKITREEYRGMCWGFLPKIEQPLQEAFRESLKAEDFWPGWSKLLSENRRNGLSESWGQWRMQKIFDTFESRLESMDLSEDVASGAFDSFLKSRTTQTSQLDMTRSNGQYARPASTVRLLGPAPQRSSLPTYREIIHRAIDQLGDDDLQRIWLPIGVVLDVIKKNNGSLG